MSWTRGRYGNMKKEYNFFVSGNMPNLKLFTQLIGLCFGTLGLNFLLAYLYGRFAVDFEYSAMLPVLSVIMFVLTPIVVTDEKRANRGLFAVICGEVMRAVCTISLIVMLNFKALIIVYSVELLIDLFLVVRNRRVHKK